MVIQITTLKQLLYQNTYFALFHKPVINTIFVFHKILKYFTAELIFALKHPNRTTPEERGLRLQVPLFSSQHPLLPKNGLLLPEFAVYFPESFFGFLQLLFPAIAIGQISQKCYIVFQNCPLVFHNCHLFIYYVFP